MVIHKVFTELHGKAVNALQAGKGDCYVLFAWVRQSGTIVEEVDKAKASFAEAGYKITERETAQMKRAVARITPTEKLTLSKREASVMFDLIFKKLYDSYDGKLERAQTSPLPDDRAMYELYLKISKVYGSLASSSANRHF